MQVTLREVFEQAKKDGFTHAADIYSYHGRKIDNWGKEIFCDNADYSYQDGLAKQNSKYPSNEFYFWKKIPEKAGCR